MSRFTLAAYRYLRQHKALLYILMLGSFAIFLALGLQIKYEEDISKLLPSNTIGDSEQLVFDNLKVKDKIFILFTEKTPPMRALWTQTALQRRVTHSVTAS